MKKNGIPVFKSSCSWLAEVFQRIRSSFYIEIVKKEMKGKKKLQ